MPVTIDKPEDLQTVLVLLKNLPLDVARNDAVYTLGYCFDVLSDNKVTVMLSFSHISINVFIAVSSEDAAKIQSAVDENLKTLAIHVIPYRALDRSNTIEAANIRDAVARKYRSLPEWAECSQARKYDLFLEQEAEAQSAIDQLESLKLLKEIWSKGWPGLPEGVMLNDAMVNLGLDIRF